MRVAWLLLAAACQPPMGEAEPEGTSTGEAPLEAPEGSLLRNPFAPLPDRLSQTGLYLVLPDRTVTPDAAIAYEPLWPLWSNGSEKSRFLVLPEGTTIDNVATPWVFPDGTLLWKTFAYGDLPIETRLIRRRRGGEWQYAVYRWEGDDATRLDIDLPVPVEAPLGTHTIPAELDCRSCHESADSVVLGLSELQLAPLLPALADAGVFAGPIPSVPRAIEHEDDTTRRVLGWLHGDCVHCHNGLDGDNSSFDLRADVALDNLIGVESDNSGSAGGIRVVPGDPDASLMFQAISGVADVKAMPPVGVDVRDAATIELVRAWIEGLP